VGEAVARASRNIGRFDLAIPLYRNLRGRFPESWRSALGLALSLGESGRTENALALGRELAALHPENPEILLGLAWIHRHRKEHLETLRFSERVLALEPENRGARRLHILAVADLGAPFLALQEAEKRPGALSVDEIRRLRADRDSRAVLWGELPAPTPAERFAATDRALALLDADLADLPPDAPARRRIRLDRLVALRDRLRMEEIVAEYGRLEKEGVELPPYALRACGDAFLHLRRPEKAADLYRRVLQGMPGDFETQMSLFYALVEAEEWEQAFALADAVAAEERAWRWGAGAKEPRENWQKEEADTTALMARAYGDMLGPAQEGLEPRLAAAPRNTDLRQKTATVYRWRGWPAKAEEEYRIALASDPPNLQVRLGLAHALLDRKKYAEAGPAVEALAREYPENRHVADLAARWERLHKWYFTAEAGFAHGEENQIGTRELSFRTRLYAPPVALHWRPFLHGYYEEAKFTEGTASYRRTGVGLEYDAPGWRVAGLLDGSVDGGVDPGLTIDAAWSPDDIWTFAGEAATFSTEVPLRARRQGIDGQSARLSILRRWHESRSVRFALGLLDMSDGNVRTSGQLSLEERLVTRPRFRLTGVAELYASANSQDDAPYFNPERDLAASLSGVWEWLLWRRYEASLRHSFLLGLGTYTQEGFGTAPIFTAGYEQEWHPNLDLGLRYGATWSSRVYDGDREGRLGYHLVLDWRF
jgi:biofilm PGA synthesis protein PgaA